MSQNFSVNGKEYVLSSTLAASYGYTSDYIGRLAREEKILGSLIGRQWFIEPESLKIFVCQTAIEKEIRKEKLSAERKLTLQVRQKEELQVKTPPLFFAVFAQTCIVLFCGLFIGALSWVMVVEKIGVSEISNGITESGQFIAKSITPTRLALTSRINSDSSLAASAEMVPLVVSENPTYKEIFTILPTFSTRVPFYSSTTSSSGVDSDIDNREFSDEVKIVFDEKGNEIIVPIFKNKATSSYRFLVTPVNEVES